MAPQAKKQKLGEVPRGKTLIDFLKKSAPRPVRVLLCEGGAERTRCSCDEVGSDEGEAVCKLAVVKFNRGNRLPANSRTGPRPWRSGKHKVVLDAESDAVVVDPVSGLRLPA